jgi:hypothetical protein
MTPEALIADLNGRGIELSARGGTITVRPASRLTDQDRTFIRALKPSLVSMLAACPTPRRDADLPVADREDTAEPDEPPQRTHRWMGLDKPLPLRPCPCGSKRFWLGMRGAIKCAACSVPDIEAVEAWLTPVDGSPLANALGDLERLAEQRPQLANRIASELADAAPTLISAVARRDRAMLERELIMLRVQCVRTSGRGNGKR